MIDFFRFMTASCLSNWSCRFDKKRRWFQTRIASLFNFIRDSNRLLGRRLRPDRQLSTERVAQNAGSKVVFMIPFDLGHLQQAFNKFRATRIARVTGRRLVLEDVSALEFSRTIHRGQPSRHVTKEAQTSLS